MKKMLAFTLAEVLITLSILGVVAAITVPSLIKRNEERSTVTKVLKAHSTLSHVADALYAESGASMSWLMDFPGDMGAHRRNLMAARFYNRLNTTKICQAGASPCFITTKQVSINGVSDWQTYAEYGAALLKDGSSVAYQSFGNCNYDLHNSTMCGRFYFDVNGPNKGGNKWGEDIFIFDLTSKGIVTPDYTSADCSKTGTKSAVACSTYIIKNKNMNYLH